MAQGTYSELQGSGLDFVSLLKSDEEPERGSRSADTDRLSLRSHSSLTSYNSLLPPESCKAEQLPVGTSPEVCLLLL